MLSGCRDALQTRIAALSICSASLRSGRLPEREESLDEYTFFIRTPENIRRTRPSFVAALHHPPVAAADVTPGV